MSHVFPAGIPIRWESYLGCDNMDPRFTFIQVTEHGVKISDLAAHLVLVVIQRLFQRHFLQDNVVQCVAVKCDCGIRIFDFCTGGMVQYAVFRFQFVFVAALFRSILNTDFLSSAFWPVMCTAR